MNTRTAPTILNVNDHEQTRYVVTRMLKLAGFSVIEAASGEQALRLAERKPDLVVLDVKLPDISGLEVCRMLKSRPETASIYILHTSATFVTAERKIAGLDSGADGYLTHPFEPAELIATVKSLLRLKAAEEGLRERARDLVEADRRKDEFLAMLAHELRNPLSAISAATSLLGPTRTDPARFDRTRRVIERQTKQLARLVDDLLDVSRVTQGKINLQQTLCDLRAIVRDEIEAARPSSERRRQKIVLEESREPVVVCGDRTRLHQVVANLIDNAGKYSPEGSRIEVSVGHAVSRRGARARLVVRDHGKGIGADFLPRVFDLFAQEGAALDRTRGGMGIGLTMAKRLVELHGGELYVRSDGIGKGTEVELVLPHVDGEPETRPTPVGPPPSSANGVRVLVVEDNDDARDTLCELLALHGHRVECASDGQNGLALALSCSFDVAVIDVGLPLLDGYELAARLRASGCRAYLIALTGYGSAEQQARALRSGFDLHFAKPVDGVALLHSIALCANVERNARSEPQMEASSQR